MSQARRPLQHTGGATLHQPLFALLSTAPILKRPCNEQSIRYRALTQSRTVLRTFGPSLAQLLFFPKHVHEEVLTEQ
jgi:hypothetical protein